jgi:hypothetical protein
MSDHIIIEGEWTGEGRAGKRPRLTIPHTQLEVYCELIAAITLANLTVYLASIWSLLPSKMPVHFNFAGQADRWGTRIGLLSLYGVTVALYAGFNMLQRFPHIYNYPFGLTTQNIRRQYQLARQLLTLIKTEIVCFLAFVEWGTIQVARGRSQGLGIWLTPVLLLAILGAIVYYFVQASNAR